MRYFRHGAVAQCDLHRVQTAHNKSTRARRRGIINRITGRAARFRLAAMCVSIRRGLTVINEAEAFVVLNSAGQVSETPGASRKAARSYRNSKDEKSRLENALVPY